MAKKDEAATGTAAATEKTRRTRATKPADAETDAIRVCTDSLRPLTPAARERVLNYVQARLQEPAAA